MEKLIPYGIPVSKEYTQIAEKDEIKNKLNLQKDKEYILILTGSMGFGNTSELIRNLLLEIKEVIFIIACGNNKKMLETLNKEFSKEKRVIALAYTKQISEYIKMSEIVLTKPRWTYNHRNSKC